MDITIFKLFFIMPRPQFSIRPASLKFLVTTRFLISERPDNTNSVFAFYLLDLPIELLIDRCWNMMFFAQSYDSPCE